MPQLLPPCRLCVNLTGIRCKVGDLVVVGSDEGYVRKISVRSTEVETYERSRILIPNSYLITEKVKNWTLRDNLRRIEIPVSVARGSDPRKVTVILLKVAQDNPNVMKAPAPSVELEDFTADSLQFKLYAFIDLDKGGTTSTDLRIAILDAFDGAGITSPSRQTDVNLRNVEWLRGMVAEYASAASNGRTTTNRGHGSHHFPEHHDQRVQAATHLPRNGKPVSA